MKKAHRRVVLVSMVLVVLALLTMYWLFNGNRPLQPYPHSLTLANFEFVRLGMTLDEISGRLGTPHVRAVHMYEYELADNSRVIFRTHSSQVRGIWILDQDGTRVDFFTKQVIPEPSLNDFAFVKPGILYDEVIERVGEPYLDTGSGLHTASYQLIDGRNLLLVLGARGSVTGTVEVVDDAWVVSGKDAVNFFDK